MRVLSLLLLSLCCCCLAAASPTKVEEHEPSDADIGGKLLLVEASVGELKSVISTTLLKMEESLEVKMKDFIDSDEHLLTKMMAQQAVVSHKVHRLENKMETVELMLNQVIKNTQCTEYKYFVTPKRGTFDQIREECKSYGGDLVHKSLGENGLEYHDRIRALVTTGEYWIGLHDRHLEGRWTTVDGYVFDAKDRRQNRLYYWRETDQAYGGQPDGGTSQNCAFVHGPHQALYDYDCGYQTYGICEVLQAC